MIENRAPGRAWFARRDVGKYPNGYVVTAPNEMVRVTWFEADGSWRNMFLSRRDARLLARRINQCLDGTVKR